MAGAGELGVASGSGGLHLGELNGSTDVPANDANGPQSVEGPHDIAAIADGLGQVGGSFHRLLLTSGGVAIDREQRGRQVEEQPKLPNIAIPSLWLLAQQGDGLAQIRDDLGGFDPAGLSSALAAAR